MKVYVDGIMLINFLVDGLLLLGTNRLAGYPSSLKRVIMAALFGAFYSGVCMLPDFRFLGNTLWRLVSLGLLGSIAFGWNRGAIRRCGMFVLLSFSLGGVALCFERTDGWVLILAGAGLWILCRLTVDGVPGNREYVPLEIYNGGKSLKLLALRDTGNTLHDPVTGEQALIITPDAAEKLTGLTRQQLRQPMETLASRCLPGLRLLPFRTVGQGNGMMLAMGFDRVILNGRTGRALVAFAPENFGAAGYQALTGGAAW